MAEIGLMLDCQGKTDKAFAAYQQAFGFPLAAEFFAADPFLTEALARYGGMCTASPTTVRTMLYIVRGIALGNKNTGFVSNRSAEALAAFQEAAKLMPADLGVHYVLSYGMSHVQPSENSMPMAY